MKSKWPTFRRRPRRTSGKYDDRPEAIKLLSNIKRSLPDLRKLKLECEEHWGFEDKMYRFYHQSFKVFSLQSLTEKIVVALRKVAPKTRRKKYIMLSWREERRTGVMPNWNDLHPWFLTVIKEGTGKAFKMDDNQNWPPATRPIVEAYCHAKYFLDMLVKYGGELKRAPNWLPSGWAAILYLYDLR